jgi:opacity protein-like surface antigen
MAKRQSSTLLSSNLCRARVLGLIGGVAVVTLIAMSKASAADLYAPPMAYLPPPFSWTGLYLGANLGGGWASGSLNDNFTGASVGTGSSGVVGGGKLGYNYQVGNSCSALKRSAAGAKTVEFTFQLFRPI